MIIGFIKWPKTQFIGVNMSVNMSFRCPEEAGVGLN